MSRFRVNPTRVIHVENKFNLLRWMTVSTGGFPSKYFDEIKPRKVVVFTTLKYTKYEKYEKKNSVLNFKSSI